mmetsp:Transcript_9907/g.60449  ORF Transcript_9907/g.60449 Transcript_9907/m.60449 type:complete len:80 (+) Transcript_9907:284-523(+)
MLVDCPPLDYFSLVSVEEVLLLCSRCMEVSAGVGTPSLDPSPATCRSCTPCQLQHLINLKLRFGNSCSAPPNDNCRCNA